MYLKIENKEREIYNSEFYDFIVKTEYADLTTTYILQQLRGYCCYGRLTNDGLKHHKILELDMNVYVPKVKYENVKDYYGMPASGWYREDDEFYARIQHMHDVLEKFYEIPHSLSITNHEDVKPFLPGNIDTPYFQLHFHFENTRMYVIYFVLDMYRRCFNLFYDLYWPIITELEKECVELNMIDLWLLSDLLNYKQPSDANLSIIYNSNAVLIDKSTFQADTQESGNQVTLADNIYGRKRWIPTIDSSQISRVGKQFEVTIRPEQQPDCYIKVKENFKNLIDQFIKKL